MIIIILDITGEKKKEKEIRVWLFLTGLSSVQLQQYKAIR